MLCHCVFPPSVGDFNLLDGSWAEKLESWMIFLVENNRLVKMVVDRNPKSKLKLPRNPGVKLEFWEKFDILPETNRIEPEKRPKPNWKIVFQPCISRCFMAMWVSGRVYPGKWRFWSPNMEVRFRWFSCPVQILLNFVGGKNPTNRNTMRWRFYNQSLGLDFSPLNWKYDNLLRFRCPAHVYSPGYKKNCLFNYGGTQKMW